VPSVDPWKEALRELERSLSRMDSAAFRSRSGRVVPPPVLDPSKFDARRARDLALLMDLSGSAVRAGGTTNRAVMAFTLRADMEGWFGREFCAPGRWFPLCGRPARGERRVTGALDQYMLGRLLLAAGTERHGPLAAFLVARGHAYLGPAPELEALLGIAPGGVWGRWPASHGQGREVRVEGRCPVYSEVTMEEP
jgi:hypothetical protein